MIANVIGTQNKFRHVDNNAALAFDQWRPAQPFHADLNLPDSINGTGIQLRQRSLAEHTVGFQTMALLKAFYAGHDRGIIDRSCRGAFGQIAKQHKALYQCRHAGIRLAFGQFTARQRRQWPVHARIFLQLAIHSQRLHQRVVHGNTIGQRLDRCLQVAVVDGAGQKQVSIGIGKRGLGITILDE